MPLQIGGFGHQKNSEAKRSFGSQKTVKPSLLLAIGLSLWVKVGPVTRFLL
jgi:hypothetical protein